MPPRNFRPILAGLILQAIYSQAQEANWPQFRGENQGLAANRELPKVWNKEKGIAWTNELSGFGQSSPVVWQDSVYITSTGGAQKEHLYLEAFSLKSGKRKWVQKVAASKIVKEVSKMISQGAPTPVAGPNGVYAFFESGDLTAFDHDGQKLWHRKLQEEFGDFMGGHGVGSSLVGSPGKIFLLIDHDGPSYLLCLDRRSGKTLWKTDRGPRVSWTTPLIFKNGEQIQILISSNGIAEALRAEDGKRLWWVEDLKRNTVASPATDGNFMIIGSSDPRQSVAIRMDGKGDVSKTHVAWRTTLATSSFASPIIDRGIVYLVNRTGMLQALSLETGEQLWKERLPASTWASPISDGNHLYFFCKNGKSVVFDTSAKQPKIIAENSVGITKDETLYGVAAGQKSFILRSGRKIFKVGQ